MVLVVLYALAQHVDHAALRDLALQPREKLQARRSISAKRKGFVYRFLR